MSGTGPLPPISGRFGTLRPWHYIVIAGICGGALLIGPVLTHFVNEHDKRQARAIQQAGRIGEPWHAPQLPAERTPPTEPKVIPVAASTQLRVREPQNILRSGQAPADPEQIADNAPIGIASATLLPSQMGHGDGAMSQVVSVSHGKEGDGGLGDMLKPTELSGYRATRIQHPSTTIEQGRIIRCEQVTALTSQMAGFVKAVIPYDVKGVDGSTVLIDAGSTAFGEIARGLVAGQDRVFVLWRQITTPAPYFVRITLNSPAADELGEAGLPGTVNHHIWAKIGGALMLSGVQGGLQALTLGLSNALSGNGGNGGGSSNLNFYQFQGQGSGLASDLLRNTINIPDTLHRDQGEACSIFVSGDLDFGSAYKVERVRMGLR